MLTTLALATRFFCTLPGGTITEAGIHLIKSLLTFTLPDDWQWVARVGGKGEYVGTLAKRIAKYVHNNHLPKLPNDLLGAIGSAANDYTSKPSDYEFELADSFDWSPGDFSDGGVCFGPGGCRESAPGLICQQGRAIKFYRNGNKWARAWLYPAPFGVVTFNGYGIQCVEVARVLAHYWGVARIRKSASSTTVILAGRFGLTGEPDTQSAPTFTLWTATICGFPIVTILTLVTIVANRARMPRESMVAIIAIVAEMTSFHAVTIVGSGSITTIVTALATVTFVIVV